MLPVCPAVVTFVWSDPFPLTLVGYLLWFPGLQSLFLFLFCNSRDSVGRGSSLFGVKAGTPRRTGSFPPFLRFAFIPLFGVVAAVVPSCLVFASFD